jgi:molybdopterin converting factor small subunit
MSGVATSTIAVRVLLFGIYAETLAFDAVELVLDSPATVADAVERLRALPHGERIPPRPLCALNFAQAGMNAPITPGDELAVLPPLAGG